MAKLQIVAGATSQSVQVFIQDNTSTTGAGLTGLVFNSSGLTAYYNFNGTNGTSTQITLATLAAVNSAYSSGGFKEIDATNMPGIYRLDLPNAALAASKGRSVVVYLQGATHMAPCVFEIELTAVDNQSTGFGLVNASANVVEINGISTSSVTTVNANIGLTEAATFDGNNLLSVNLVDVNGNAAIETGLNPFQALRLIASTTGAKLSGAGSGTETFRNAVADSANRVVATVDSSGNRTAITYNL